jgi:hypothetical protein
MKMFAKTAAATAFLAMTSLVAPSSRAATVAATGGTFDGWMVTPVSGITLTADATSSSNLLLTKAANFSNMEGLVITFTQVAANAAPTLTFQNETLTNNSGSTWGGFQFLLMNPGASAAFVSSSTSPFAPATGYTSGTFSSDSIVYAGAQANTATTQWGFNANGDLVISSNPGAIGTTFDLKEIPLLSSQVVGASAGGVPITLPGAGGTPIPLPAAVYQGLVGLMGIALFGFAKNIRKAQIQ